MAGRSLITRERQRPGGPPSPGRTSLSCTSVARSVGLSARSAHQFTRWPEDSLTVDTLAGTRDAAACALVPLVAPWPETRRPERRTSPAVAVGAGGRLVKRRRARWRRETPGTSSW